MTELPNGQKIVKSAGASRRRVLSSARTMLLKSMTKEEYAADLKLSRRTIERLLDDAVEVGFKRVVKPDGKIVLSLGKRGRR